MQTHCLVVLEGTHRQSPQLQMCRLRLCTPRAWMPVNCCRLHQQWEAQWAVSRMSSWRILRFWSWRTSSPEGLYPPMSTGLARGTACCSGWYSLLPGFKEGKRCVVPFHMRETIMEENHGGQMAKHFSGEKLYKLLRRHWWWPRMYTDVVEHCRSCPECAIVNSSGQVNVPPLHPIPVQRVFQIVGVNVMDLPITEAGNKHVVVFQDFLSKYIL